MFRPFAIILILIALPLPVSGDIEVVFGPSPDLPETIVKTIDGAAWTLDATTTGGSVAHSLVVSVITAHRTC